MDAKITTVNWQKSLALDSTPVIFDIPYTTVNIFPVIQDIQSNRSFLHSQKLKQSIIESKRAFLNLSLTDQKPEDDQLEEKSLVLGNLDGKKSISKKISFKIKKQASVYKRNVGSPRVTNIPANRVSELTKKFNDMVEKQHIIEEQQSRMGIKRGDSLCSETDKVKKTFAPVVHKDSIKVSRKPSVKTKPLLESKHLVIIKTKPTRKTSIKKQNSDKFSAHAKIKETEKLQTTKKQDDHILRPTTLSLNLNIPKAIIETSPNGTSVRAAIEIFERKSAVSSPTKHDSTKDISNIFLKPKVPDKSIAVKNLSKTATLPTSFKVPKNVQTNILKNDIQPVKHIIQNILSDNNKNDKAEFEEDKVQIINIPAVLPQRRCDSMYETLNLKKISSHAIKSKSVDNINKDIENKQSFSAQPNNSFLWKDKSSPITCNTPYTNENVSENINKTNISENNKKLPPDIPFKPPIDLIKPVTPPKILKKKIPLPYPPNLLKNPDSANDELPDYEEIGCNIPVILNDLKNLGSDEVILNEEKFKGYDEIIKPINDVEIIKIKTADSEVHYEEIKKSLSNEKNKKLNTSEAKKYYEEINAEEKVYEEVVNVDSKNDDGYEPIGNKAEEHEIYERCSSPATENIYETLPVPQIPLRRQQQEPLPPRPPSSTKNEEAVDNCYESIYTETKKDCYYESIYGSQLTDSGSNRDSVLSSDHKSNSLYGKSLPQWDYSSDATYYKPPSDTSCSDRLSNRSDEWEDVTDNDEEDNRIIIIREKPKGRKSGWSKHFREQLSKSLKDSSTNQFGDETDHHYESLYATKEDEDFDYDSFESDTESDSSFDKIRIVDDSGIDIGSNQLPDPPNSQTYGLMKFAEKHMKKIKRNFSIDITKSLTRMKKHISKTDTDISGLNKEEKKSIDVKPKTFNSNYENVETKNPVFKQQIPYQTVEITKNSSPESQNEEQDKSKTLSRKGGFLNKFRRSMSLSAESANELTSNLNGNKTKSTFYLTEAIDIDNVETQKESLPVEDKSISPVLKQAKSPILRPTSPPPPAPISHSDLRKSNRKDGKSSSWYADSGLFRNTDNSTSKRPNSYWYAEVGLYQTQTSSPPSTSSAENSGSNLSIPIKPFEIPRPVLKTSDFINQDDSEKYNNMKNDTAYYTDSVNSFNSLETKKDESLKQEMQLRLQDEPLYQFYDAAVLESISYGDTSDFDSDNYEDIIEKDIVKQIKIRPSAMELVSPKRNSICFTKTLWCEIPEVINSSVLSTLSAHQKKIQEAKFEILTSEASYLNSLNVLSNHFVKNFEDSNILTTEEKEILFGHVEKVRNSSEKLLHDLEKCWQDNILLHGICDIIQKHAEENFNVYIPYCENQILFDQTLKGLKKRVGFTDFLKQLEMSEACQSLFLYSFLMLPMQRITRWPLLVDAVLKRLDQQDAEYYACQFALATLNKIVSQCNEAARTKERETELQRIAKQLEFHQSVSKIPIFTSDRWLIRCGQVTHIQTRNDDTKLTFGKRFNKTSIYLFLFNDLFLVTKEKSEKNYVVLHHCPRNLVELSSSETTLTIPTKEAQGKNLIFVTVLENQDGKTIEYLLSCNSDSDKERWIEALSTPKSEDPEETLYECWDCPQVSAIHNYAASQPDELALTKGDVINVLRKMADGWYHGERIRDGQTGWFPANHTIEIANFHVRARNLKQRYRLLAFSENYLKSK